MKYINLKTGFLFIVCLLVTMGTYAQEREISGRVTDTKGESLPGVSVLIKGTTTGVATDINGKFILKTIPENVLIFSFIGYKSQEVTVGNQKTLNVTLQEESEKLDEVVVVGYGVQKKSEITGSIAKVSGKDIADRIAPSFESALSGQAAGVYVTTGSGMAGSSAQIRVRGIASIGAGGDPLYVIDGIPISNEIFSLGVNNGRTGGMNPNPLSSINPSDIESIEILKDAAATGIYGSRGANGVILITTKRAKKGSFGVDFSAQYSISNPTKKIEMLGAEEYLALRQEAWENDGNVGPAPLLNGITWEQARKNDTDWWDEVTRTGHKQNYNLALKWGNEKINVYLGGSYSKDATYMINNDFQRASGRLNLDYKPNKIVTIKLSSSLSGTRNNVIDAPWDGGLGAAMSQALPIYPIRNEDGSWFTLAGRTGNPIWVAENKKMRSSENRTINNLAVTITPLKGLTFDISGAVDYEDFRFNKYENTDLTLGLSSGNEDIRWILNYNYRIFGSYNINVKDKHDLTFMLGHEYQRSKTTGRNYWASDVTKLLSEYSQSEKDEFNYNRTKTEEWSFISYFGRLNYMFMKRYIAQASLRIDGSSRFGSNNRYGYFPTFAVGWIVTEEDFLKDNKYLTFLKLKASYGITGNSQIGNYAWRGSYTIDQTDGSKYNGVNTLYMSEYENPDLKWETTNSYDLGFEARFLNDRISTEFAYFMKKSSDVLVHAEIQKTTGFGNLWQNIAEIENEGVEFTLTSHNLTGEFKWTTEFNIASLNNKVTSLGGYQNEIGGGTNDTRIIVGQPVGVNTMVRFSRIDPEDGRPIYLNKEGQETKDYKFEGEGGYKVPAGKPIPDFTGGLTNRFSYKGFDLSVLFTFAKGFDIYDSSAKRQMGVMSEWNYRTDIRDRWRKPGDIAKYPRMTMDPATYGSDQLFFNTTQWLYDGSYMRMKDLTLGYSFPKKMMEKICLSSLRLSFTATNLVTFTKYPGADPEVARDYDNVADRNMSANVSWLTPPQERTFTFGLSASF